MTDGKIYEGGWLNGMMHGQGKIIYEDGNIKIVEWKQGNRIRWIEDNN